jgi:dsDNA-specific endonuclease/ATPase MutS2
MSFEEKYYPSPDAQLNIAEARARLAELEVILSTSQTELDEAMSDVREAVKAQEELKELYAELAGKEASLAEELEGWKKMEEEGLEEALRQAAERADEIIAFMDQFEALKMRCETSLESLEGMEKRLVDLRAWRGKWPKAEA